MNINELTIGDLKEIKSLLNQNNNQNVVFDEIKTFGVEKWCILRTYSAGVFFGKLKTRNGKEAIINYCRRMWSWSGAFTLSKVAIDGVESAKMSIEEPEKLITELIEVIPVTEKVRNQLKSMEAHND